MVDQILLRQKLSFIRSGSETERFHTDRTLQTDTIGHHSFHVAMLVDILSAGYPSTSKARLLMAALTHDLCEHQTGDIPAPTKRNLNIREIVGDMEFDMLNELGMEYESTLTAKEKRLLKLADAMDGAFFCVGERSLGNQRIFHIFENFRNYIDQLKPENDVERGIVDFIDELWERYSG